MHDLCFNAAGNLLALCTSSGTLHVFEISEGSKLQGGYLDYLRKGQRAKYKVRLDGERCFTAAFVSGDSAREEGDEELVVPVTADTRPDVLLAMTVMRSTVLRQYHLEVEDTESVPVNSFEL